MKNRLLSWLSAVIYGGTSLLARRFEVTDKAAMVFAPHADDETFGCGGLIALKAAAKVPVRVVILTDGGWLPKPCPEARRELVAKRQREALAAAAALGLEPGAVEFLGLPDGKLSELSARQSAEAVARVAALLREHRPGEIFVPHRRDRHEDHEAAYRLVNEAVRRADLRVAVYQYPIWLVWWSGMGRRLRPRDLARARVLEIDGVSSRKRAAIDAYQSQQQVLPDGFLRRLDERELFFMTQEPVQAATADSSDQEHRQGTGTIA